MSLPAWPGNNREKHALAALTRLQKNNFNIGLLGQQDRGNLTTLNLDPRDELCRPEVLVLQIAALTRSTLAWIEDANSRS